jgi:SPP1 family predicted phage head-tail adaptor
MKAIAYRLRHRVDIQEFGVTVDSNTGAVLEGWTTILPEGDESEPILMPAEIMPMSGREFVAASAIQAGVNTKITIRYMEGIKPAMRVVHEGVFYNIKAVLPDPTLRRHITLMCASGVDEG